jgi:hypothetical protein
VEMGFNARLSFSRLVYFYSRILRQKCKYDSEFLSMVNEIKTTAKDSLGLLILLPVGFSYLFLTFIRLQNDL